MTNELGMAIVHIVTLLCVLYLVFRSLTAPKK
jgi:hypothetical protein